LEVKFSNDVLFQSTAATTYLNSNAPYSGCNHQ